MKTFLECVPCFVGQALKAVRLVSDDEKIQEGVLRAALAAAAKMDFSVSPPVMGQQIHRIIRDLLENEDPYFDIKQRSNAVILELYPELKARVDSSKDPFETAVRLAIAGNIIDYAVNTDLEETEILQVIEDALKTPSPLLRLDEFRRAITQANKILYLADNAGEIVLDRLLLEQLPREKVTFVVRGFAVINDATRTDAQETGITELVEVIDNGSGVPGTILETCSDDFRRRFNEADVIIAKGQGNYETLNDVDREIFFLFKVKCPVIVRDTGEELGNMVLQKSSVSNYKGVREMPA
ncbi:MAG: DUF89 family protein [Sedimentisphaerales bacterium]|nr:DUF89 family protein [Sedimentisphaerales bacterium]